MVEPAELIPCVISDAVAGTRLNRPRRHDFSNLGDSLTDFIYAVSFNHGSSFRLVLNASISIRAFYSGKSGKMNIC